MSVHKLIIWQILASCEKISAPNRINRYTMKRFWFWNRYRLKWFHTKHPKYTQITTKTVHADSGLVLSVKVVPDRLRELFSREIWYIEHLLSDTGTERTQCTHPVQLKFTLQFTTCQAMSLHIWQHETIHYLSVSIINVIISDYYDQFHISCPLCPADLKLHLQSTDYGSFLANEASPLTVSVIDDKLKEKMVVEFRHMRNQSYEPLASFMDFIT